MHLPSRPSRAFLFLLLPLLPLLLAGILVRQGVEIPWIGDGLDRITGRRSLEEALEEARAAPPPALSLLAGRVLAPEGEPAAGAEVRIWRVPPEELLEDPSREPDLRLTADEEGRFEAPGLEGDFVVEGRAPGLRSPWRAAGVLEAGQRREDLELALEATRMIRGRVVGPTGRPLEGARVRALPLDLEVLAEPEAGPGGLRLLGPAPGETRTDAEGVFVLHPLARGTWRLEVRHPDHPKWTGVHPAEGGDLEIRLDLGLGLAGRVRDEGGRPLAGAEILLRSPAEERRLESGADGRFEVFGLEPAESADLVVQAPGFARAFLGGLPLRRRDVQETVVDLEPGFTLAGRAVDPNGEPVAGALVELETGRRTPEGRPWEEAVGLASTRTDEDGRWAFEGVPAGGLRLVFHDPEKPVLTEERVVAASEAADLEVLLDPHRMRRLSFEGRVRSVSGEPLQSFRVTLFRPGGTGLVGESRSFEEPSGAFEWLALEPGPVAIQIEAEGHAPWRRPLREYGLGTWPLEAVLRPASSGVLTLRDRGGAPRAAEIAFEDPESGQALPVAAGAGLWRERLSAGPEGRVPYAGLPAGKVRLRARLEEEEVERVLDLPPGPGQEIEAVLPVDPEPAPRLLTLYLVDAGRSLEAVPVEPGTATAGALASLYRDGGRFPAFAILEWSLEREDGEVLARGRLLREGERWQEADGPEGSLPVIRAELPPGAVRLRWREPLAGAAGAVRLEIPAGEGPLHAVLGLASGAFARRPAGGGEPEPEDAAGRASLRHAPPEAEDLRWEPVRQDPLEGAPRFQG